MFAQAEQRLDAGRFEAAEQALDCADAVIGDEGDARSRYELTRRRGILDFRRERIPQALERFECAVAQSRTLGDRTAEARDLKNVGAALRRLGDFRGALRSLTASLEIQRAQGEISGAVLNNIADVYRELRESETAMRYYRDALAFYRAKGDPAEAAHVQETRAEVALDGGDTRQASAWLQEALAVYRNQGNRVYELRVHDGLIRAALALGDVPQARRWSAGALALAETWKLPLPAALQLQIARTARFEGNTASAAARLREALDAAAEGDPARVPLLEELATVQESMGDVVAANATLRRVNAEAAKLMRAQHDRQLDWLRIRFEAAEQQRTIAVLESENRLRGAQLRQRTLLLWLALVSGVAAALGFWLLLQRRRQRERLREEARRIRHEEELARYRREADALAEDRSLLQTLLDSREDAVCLLDAEGQVLAANRAGGLRLGAAPASPPVGQAVSAFVAEADRPALLAALERMEDSAAQRLEFATRQGRTLLASLEPWAGGDGLVVLALRERADAQAQQAAPGEDRAQDGAAPSVRDAFRRVLVELMLAVIDAWEGATGTGRLELAERSRIWRVNIDDGRLRARAMERYLAVSKLPRNPRWRDVLRSAYFVLAQCEGLSADTRAALQTRIDAVLAYTRRDAFV
ncbi:tetratricopeptide repeat protein [Luteimonas aquatica]|uniref:tetratricopeptide repeat protein n=1 Tax=Luteimonas aquatica TaxID=450364 RepID=UPI001F55EBA5|nr:tetratricopeptide repeat protein [Luteimonas aquatica]